MASLCVMCKMARLLDSEELYRHYKDLLDRGSAAFEKLLWNGESKQCSPDLKCNSYVLVSDDDKRHKQMLILRLVIKSNVWLVFKDVTSVFSYF